MARPEEVISEREFVSRSMQWYRTIGRHRYRFRVTWKPGGDVAITSERAAAYRKWELAHSLTLTAIETPAEVR